MRYFVANIICFHSEYNEPTQLLSSCSKNPIFAVDEHITENVRSAYHNHCRAIYGAVCIQLTDFPCDNCENTRTLSYYHQQIGGMTHLPLGLGHCMRYIPFYVLTFIVLLSFTRAVPRQMVQKTPWLIYLSLNWANYMHVLRKSPIIPHDDVIKWKHFPRNWPFVRGIHRSRWIPHTKASDAELDVFFDLRLNKPLSNQSWGWWFETLSRSLWRHRNAPSFRNVANEWFKLTSSCRKPRCLTDRMFTDLHRFSHVEMFGALNPSCITEGAMFYVFSRVIYGSAAIVIMAAAKKSQQNVFALYNSYNPHNPHGMHLEF